jgi:hypothetical protein
MNHDLDWTSPQPLRPRHWCAYALAALAATAALVVAGLAEAQATAPDCRATATPTAPAACPRP